ncbi:MAG: hypothetical protein JXM69_08250 [Anaerolineae bacterium]|nr:hypothetical protein [Anaerolineae bacterium]
MEVKGENYHVIYNPETATVTCQGSIRVHGISEYNHIVQLLSHVVAQKPDTVILDLRELEFLSSSGINILSRFVIKIREQRSSNLIVRAAFEIPWQQKSLRNLQRLMAGLELVWE